MLSFKNPSLFSACISSLADQTMLNYLLHVPPVEGSLRVFSDFIKIFWTCRKSSFNFFFFGGGGFPKKQGFSIELSLYQFVPVWFETIDWWHNGFEICIVIGWLPIYRLVFGYINILSGVYLCIWRYGNWMLKQNKVRCIPTWNWTFQLGIVSDHCTVQTCANDIILTVDW